MKYTPKTKPFKHQAKATIRAARKRNYAFFFEPRCGKSKAGLDTVGIWALAGHVQKVLILCPSIAKDVWAKQIRLHYPHYWEAEDFDSRWSTRTRIFAGSPPETKFFIASREEVFRREIWVKPKLKKGGYGKWVKKNSRKKSHQNSPKWDYRRPRQEELEKWEPDVVIVDESHEYKKAGGVSAQDCWRLVRRLRVRYLKRHPNAEHPKPWVLEMSGTPGDEWMDLFAQFRIMDETIFGSSKAGFEDDHCVYGHGKKKWTIIKYKGEKRIERKVHAHSMTVTAEQAGLANKVFYQRLNVKLPPRAYKMYLELAEEFIVEWEGGIISAKNAGVKRLRLLQLCGGYTTDGTEIHRAKVEKYKAYLSLLLEQGESVVVYSRFTPEVGACTDAAEDVGFRTFRVDGTIGTKDRRRAVAALETRPSTPTAVVFQHQAGSRAIELVGAAETVYYSAPDGWVEYRQTSARTQGPNQKRPVRQTFLTVPGTVDVGAIRGLKRKEEWHDTLYRDPRAYLFGL